MTGLIVERVDVWAASVKDEPGALAGLLGGLHEVGADLDFVLARRAPDKPGEGVVFVTPLRGDVEIDAAATLGFIATSSVDALRVEGDNKAGIAAELAAKLGSAGINMRGLSAAVIGSRFIAYIGFDSADDALKAMQILQEN